MNHELVWSGLGVLAMSLATILMLRSSKIGLGAAPLIAVARAIVQLAVIALVLHGVFSHPWSAVLVITVMLAVASHTAASRLSGLPDGRRAAYAGVITTGIVTVVLIFVLQMMSLEVRYVIAVAGIIIGNSMSGVTLVGRNFLRQCRASRGEVEGWLALGARPVQAFAEVRRISIREALIPTIDQTKATGLVTLPGAFVGALMGGASPVEAARFQVVVLVGIMFAITLGGHIVTAILSRSTVIPADE